MDAIGRSYNLITTESLGVLSKNFLCKISGPFLKVKSIILLFPCCVKRIHISLLSHFILQLGQTSKAFEHLGNALTYDPSNVKVRFWHSLPSLCTMYVELIFFYWHNPLN